MPARDEFFVDTNVLLYALGAEHHHLDGIPGLRRIDPVDIATVDGLI